MQSSGSNVGCKRPSLQALKLQATSAQALNQGFKLQAQVHKLQDPRARVQAYLPLVRGTSNQNKCI